MSTAHQIGSDHFFETPEGPLGRVSGAASHPSGGISFTKTGTAKGSKLKKVLPSGNELSKSISIYLTVDEQSINNYFNPHDPAPIYMRQLSHELIQYLNNCVVHAKIHSVIFYKLTCNSQLNKQYTEPLMYAIRGHFSVQKKICEAEFEKFKKRSWIMLGLSLVMVVLCHCLSTLLLTSGHTITSGLNNGIDIFSWVILWRPIDQLVFQWNPHLKDISLLNKLSTAEALVIDRDNPR